MAETKTWFTKTIARDTVKTLADELIELGEISVEVAEQFNKLFASARKGGGATTTVKVDGEIVGKKCSYLQRYLPISEFGTLGKEEDGTPKYAYQSKEGAKLSRKAKSAYEEAIAAADLALEETEDVAQWKADKAEAKSVLDEEVVSELGFETSEELIADLA